MKSKRKSSSIILNKYMKFCFDYIVSFASLVIVFPIIIIVSCLVRIKLGSPIIFKQMRPGYMGKPFVLYKFRTMMDKCDINGTLLSDDKRLTSFGILLRSTSLDELPELINVIKGEMSIVGPRPLLMQYTERYSPEQARRHEVKPGITGWAQVNGRNAISWDDKFKLDVWYVNNLSLWLDIKIILLTVLQVFKRDGISQDGQATMEEFKGL